MNAHRRGISIGIVAVLLIGAFLTVVPYGDDGAEAASPYQNLAGEDYIANANSLANTIVAEAGRQTSDANDGSNDWNENVSHEVVFDKDLLEDTGMMGYESYETENVSIDANGKLWPANNATVFTDNFNDNVVAATWKQVENANNELIEQNQRTETEGSGNIANVNFQYQRDPGLLNNYTTKISGQSLLWGDSGGLYVFSTNASFVNNNQNTNKLKAKVWIDMLSTNPATRNAIAFYYRNHAGTVYSWAKASSVWVAGEDPWVYGNRVKNTLNYKMCIESTATTYKFSLYNITNGGTIMESAFVLKSAVWGGTTENIGGFGQPFLTSGPSQWAASKFDDYSMTLNPDTWWYKSPAVPCGANNSVFHHIDWSGNQSVLDMTCQIRTSNDGNMTYPSTWHTVENATSYISSLWQGSWMQFRFTWVDPNAAIRDIQFYTHGSSYGIPFNGSEGITVIDRDTRWFGQSLILSHDINISSSSQISVYIQNTTINCDDTYGFYSYEYSINSMLMVENTTISTANLVEAFDVELPSYYYNCTFYETDMALDNYICQVRYCDFLLTNAFSYSVYLNGPSCTFDYNYFYGGHNTTHSGILCLGPSISYNYLRLVGGGPGIYAPMMMSDQSIDHNYILYCTDVAINITGGFIAYDMTVEYNVIKGLYNNTLDPDHLEAAILVDDTMDGSEIEINNNYLRNINNSHEHPAIWVRQTSNISLNNNFVWDLDVFSAFHIGRATDNATVYANFIFNNTVGGLATWTGWDEVGRDNVTISQNTFVNMSIGGIMALFDNATFTGNDFYNCPYDYLLFWGNYTIIGGHVDTTKILYNAESNISYQLQTTFGVWNKEGNREPAQIVLTENEMASSTSGNHVASNVAIYAPTWRKWTGVNSSYNVTYTVLVDNINFKTAEVTEDGLTIASSDGGTVTFQATGNHTYIITQVSEYQGTIDALDGLLELFADFGTMLGLNIGEVMTAVVFMMLFSAVLLALAGIITFVIGRVKAIREAWK